MGQKTNPIGIRLGINKTWDSVWFDEKNYASKLHEDILIREFLNKKLSSYSPISIKCFSLNIIPQQIRFFKQFIFINMVITAMICN